LLVHLAILFGPESSSSAECCQEAAWGLLCLATLLKDQRKSPESKAEELVVALIHTMQQFEGKDDSSFGVSTIWIDDFREIPKLLRDLQQAISKS
jgi:hypothetical protein